MAVGKEGERTTYQQRRSGRLRPRQNIAMALLGLLHNNDRAPFYLFVDGMEESKVEADESSPSLSSPWGRIGLHQHGKRTSSHTATVVRQNIDSFDDNTMGFAGPVTVVATRMENQPSLSEQFMAIANTGPNDFTQRLDQMEEEEKNHEEELHLHRPNLLSLLNMRKGYSKFWIATTGTTIVAAILTFYLTPLLAHVSEATMALSSSSSALALTPLTWMKGGPQQGWIILDVMAVVQLLSREQVQTYIKEKILPIAWRSLKKMVYMEVWSRVWKTVGKYLVQVRAAIRKSRNNEGLGENDDKKDKTSVNWTEALPLWMSDIHSFLYSSIDRYTKSLVKKDIQVKVERVIFQVTETVSKQIEQGVESFLLVQQAGVEVASAAT